MTGEKKRIDLVQVKINGKVLPIKGFVQDFIGLTIMGMLSALHGVSQPDNVEIKIKRKITAKK